MSIIGELQIKATDPGKEIFRPSSRRQGRMITEPDKPICKESLPDSRRLSCSSLLTLSVFYPYISKISYYRNNYITA
jgi:hypothetical protein